jgi:hypothetical protein
MKTRLFPAFAAVLAVTAVAGGCSDAPMAPDPEEAGLGAPARRDESPDPLVVALHCTYQWSSELFCEATASGGTGTGYTFNWSYNSYYHSYSSAGDYSSAWSACPGNEMYSSLYYAEPWVSVQVTDSGDGWAEVSTGNYQCSYGWQLYEWQDKWYYSYGGY